MSDIVGLGIGMKAAGMFGGQMGNMFGDFGADTGKQPDTQTGAISAAQQTGCPKCGAAIPTGSKFCLECGEKIEILPSGMVICPECGKTVQKGKFCPECGHKFISVCPNCGKEVPDGAKFCLECGTKL